MDVDAKRHEIAELSRRLGPVDPATLHARAELDAELLDQNSPALLDFRRETLQSCSDGLGADHPTTITAAIGVGAALNQVGEHARAGSLLATALRMASEQQPDLDELYAELGRTYRHRNDLAKAYELLGRAASQAERLYGQLSQQALARREEFLPIAVHFKDFAELFAVRSANHLTRMVQASASQAQLDEERDTLARFANRCGLLKEWQQFLKERESLVPEVVDGTPQTLFACWHQALDLFQQRSWPEAAEALSRTAEFAERRAVTSADRLECRLLAAQAYAAAGQPEQAARQAEWAMIHGVDARCPIELWATAARRCAELWAEAGRTEKADRIRRSVPADGGHTDMADLDARMPNWRPLLDWDDRIRPGDLAATMRQVPRRPSEQGATATASRLGWPGITAIFAGRWCRVLLSEAKYAPAADRPQLQTRAYHRAVAATQLAEAAHQWGGAAAYQTVAALIARELGHRDHSARHLARAARIHWQRLGEQVDEAELCRRYAHLVADQLS